MPSVEVNINKFYQDVQNEKRNHFLLLVLGFILIVASLFIVSIKKYNHD